MQQQNVPESPETSRNAMDAAVEARAFAMFNILIDQLEEDVLVVDEAGFILNLNARLVEAWGGAREDYIGKNCNSLEGETYRRTCGMFVDMARNTQSRVTERFTEVTSDGRMLHYQVNAFPLFHENEKGKPHYYVLTRRDTTAQAQIEERLYQSQKMAAIGELSTYVAHEIRNPLFTIGGFAGSLIRMQNLDDSARKKAQIILDESQRLDEILKSILNFAQPTGQDVGAVDINALARETVEIMGLGGEERDIPIRLALGTGIPKVHGNDEMLKQCLINLIKNAQEAMEASGKPGGSVRVGTRYIDAAVYLDVEDDGPGIPAEIHDKIFSPFFSTKNKGTGLGLAMTRKILNEINGKIHLHSRMGHGTLVSMELRPVLAVAHGAEALVESMDLLEKDVTRRSGSHGLGGGSDS